MTELDPGNNGEDSESYWIVSRLLTSDIQYQHDRKESSIDIIGYDPCVVERVDFDTIYNDHFALI